MTTENKSFTPESIRDLWRTPPAIFETLNKEFGFNCDVAASFENTFLPYNHLGEQLSGKFKDALLLDWDSVNFLNPPYSDVGVWVSKSIEQHKLGKTTVMLVPADTSVKWFKKAYNSCNEVRLISGRLSFINAETLKPVNGNNKGSVLFIWRGHCPSHSVTLVNRDDLMGVK